MNNVTKIKIMKSTNEVFEAFVDPSKIGNFWFSSSSARWEEGKTITLRYDEYNAEGDIHITHIENNKKIVFKWGEGSEEHIVTITFNAMDQESTIVEITEAGFNEEDPELLHKMLDNKEGWVYTLTCLKGYLEHGISNLRSAIVK